MAKHSYEAEGNYNLEFCIVDVGGAQDCEFQTVNVAPRVALGVEVTPSSEENSAGDPITYEVMVTNLEPDIVGNGLVAEAVSVTHELPAGLQLSSVSSAQANCSQLGQQVSCTVGDMQPGAQASMTLIATQDGSVVTNQEAGFDVSAITSTDAVRDYFVGYALTTLLVIAET